MGDSNESTKEDLNKNTKGDAKGNANEDVEVYCIGVCKYDENEPTKIEYEYYEDLKIIDTDNDGNSTTINIGYLDGKPQSDISTTLSLTYKGDKNLLSMSPVNLIAQKVRPEKIEEKIKGGNLEKIKGGNLEKMANKIRENYIPICVKMIFSNDRAECNVKQFDKIDYLNHYNHYFYQLVNVNNVLKNKPVKEEGEKGKGKEEKKYSGLKDLIDDSITLKGESKGESESEGEGEGEGESKGESESEGESEGEGEGESEGEGEGEGEGESEGESEGEKIIEPTSNFKSPFTNLFKRSGGTEKTDENNSDPNVKKTNFFSNIKMPTFGKKTTGGGLKRNILAQTAIPRIYRQVAERRTDYYNYA